MVFVGSDNASSERVQVIKKMGGRVLAQDDIFWTSTAYRRPVSVSGGFHLIFLLDRLLDIRQLLKRSTALLSDGYLSDVDIVRFTASCFFGSWLFLKLTPSSNTGVIND